MGFELTEKEIKILANRKVNLDVLLLTMESIDHRISHYPKEEKSWLREQILQYGKNLDTVSSHNFRIARKGRKDEEEVFDGDLDSFLRLGITDMMKVEVELETSPYGYTYRFGYQLNV